MSNEVKIQIFTATLLSSTPDTPDKNGFTYSKEALKQMVDGLEDKRIVVKTLIQHGTGNVNQIEILRGSKFVLEGVCKVKMDKDGNRVVTEIQELRSVTLVPTTTLRSLLESEVRDIVKTRYSFAERAGFTVVGPRGVIDTDLLYDEAEKLVEKNIDAEVKEIMKRQE